MGIFKDKNSQEAIADNEEGEAIIDPVIDDDEPDNIVVDIDTDGTKVSREKGSKIIMVMGIIVVISVVLYFFLTGKEKAPPKPEEYKDIRVTTSEGGNALGVGENIDDVLEDIVSNIPSEDEILNRGTINMEDIPEFEIVDEERLEIPDEIVVQSDAFKVPEESEFILPDEQPKAPNFNNEPNRLSVNNQNNNFAPPNIRNQQQQNNNESGSFMGTLNPPRAQNNDIAQNIFGNNSSNNNIPSQNNYNGNIPSQNNYNGNIPSQNNGGGSSDAVREIDQNPEARRRRVALSERRGTDMFLINGGGAINTSDQYDRGGIIITDKDSIASLSESSVDSGATKITNLGNTIIQGKLIYAVMETALNTDLQGTLRAIISRDVYAEAGTDILIPKGSRLIGNYASGVQKGQKRIVIGWDRLIRPDGVDIAIGSNTTDQFGRAGLEGDVDNKYAEILGNSLLTSMVSIGGLILAEQVSNSQGISTNTDGTNTSGKASDMALVDTAKKLGEQAESFVEGMINVQPTIRIPQGTKLIVFVNKDMSLPAFKIGEDRRKRRRYGNN